MPGFLRPVLASRSGRCLALGLLAVALGSWVAPAARAEEPVPVQVEGVAPLVSEASGSPRQRAFRDAMSQAALAAAEGLIEAPLDDEAREQLRAALAPGAADFILTYRVDGAVSRRPDPDTPDGSLLVVPVSATVDAARLREFLADNGWIARPAERPSALVRVRGGPGLSGPRRPAALVELEQFLVRGLEARGVVVIEPGTRPDSGVVSSPVGLARELGADVGVDVVVGWQRRAGSGGVDGGVAEVAVRALRASDGAELALSRFEAAGWHRVAEAALNRALDAVRNQVLDNVALQLDQNWQSLAGGAGPVELWLLDVGGLPQVSAVRSTLTGRLGARRADVFELAPGSAGLRVDSRLSAGALQERLVAFVFDGFRLEPVGVSGGRLELRVAPDPDAPADLP